MLLADDGKTLYATSEVANLVHVIDTEKRAVVKDIVVGNRPRRFALAAGGKELWVTSELAGEVSIIDRQKNEVTAKISFQPPGMQKTDVTPVGIALSPDGTKAHVALGQAAHVAEVDVASRKITGYVLVGKRPWGVRVSSDGKRLFVANGQSDDVTIVELPSRKAIQSVPVGRVPWGVVIDD